MPSISINAVNLFDIRTFRTVYVTYVILGINRMRFANDCTFSAACQLFGNWVCRSMYRKNTPVPNGSAERTSVPKQASLFVTAAAPSCSPFGCVFVEYGSDCELRVSLFICLEL